MEKGKWGSGPPLSPFSSQVKGFRLLVLVGWTLGVERRRAVLLHSTPRVVKMLMEVWTLSGLMNLNFWRMSRCCVLYLYFDFNIADKLRFF